jgi:succinate dehydrogenase flavin-adding protein (antitoxin of CptAB toxin-antitoxin module)
LKIYQRGKTIALPNEIKIILSKYCEVYEKKINDAQKTEWLRVFEKKDFQVFKAAFEKYVAIADNSYFPSIGKVLKIYRELYPILKSDSIIVACDKCKDLPGRIIKNNFDQKTNYPCEWIERCNCFAGNKYSWMDDEKQEIHGLDKRL